MSGPDMRADVASNRALDCPVVNIDEMFPRQHPSVSLAVGLGAASLVGLGPASGLPAILIGALARREIDASNGLFAGARLASTACVLGSIGTIGFGLLYGYLLSFASTTGAGLVALLGIALAVAWPLARRGRGVQRWLVPAAGGALALTSAVAFINRQAFDAAELERRQASCATLMTDGEAALGKLSYVVARAAFDEAHEVCPDTERRARAELLATAASEKEQARLLAEAEARRLLEEQARAAEEQQRAEEKAERDRQAASDFDAQHDALAKIAKKVTRSVRRGDLDASRHELNELVSKLQQYAESPVADDARWVALRHEASSARAVLDERALKAGKAREAREARRAAAAERERQREAKKKRAAWSSDRVRCCDGTLSPSCTYSRSLRGCCSHHGGVC